MIHSGVIDNEWKNDKGKKTEEKCEDPKTKTFVIIRSIQCHQLKHNHY